MTSESQNQNDVSKKPFLEVSAEEKRILAKRLEGWSDSPDDTERVLKLLRDSIDILDGFEKVHGNRDTWPVISGTLDAAENMSAREKLVAGFQGILKRAQANKEAGLL